jgi:hypothetical protein
VDLFRPAWGSPAPPEEGVMGMSECSVDVRKGYFEWLSGSSGSGVVRTGAQASGPVAPMVATGEPLNQILRKINKTTRWDQSAGGEGRAA